MRIACESPKLLDLGCGQEKRSGFCGIDMRDFGQDIVWDVRNGLPFQDKSIEHIYSSHFFEHLTRSELEPLMEEIWRVLSGDIHIIVPHSDTPGAYDYSHRTFWNEQSMSAFLKSARFAIDKQSRHGNNLDTVAHICEKQS